MRQWFWDRFQCRATKQIEAEPGWSFAVVCGRVRWHLGGHWWPVGEEHR